MKLLFCTSEIFPYAKSGGLGDVAHALPKELAKVRGTEIFRVMPLYGFMHKEAFVKEFTCSFVLADAAWEAQLYSHQSEGVKDFFIHLPLLSTTDACYGDEAGDYANNDLRFALFSRAVVALGEHLGVELIHANDWHTALVPLFIKELKSPIKTLFTIHNLAYQGLFGHHVLARIGLDEGLFCSEFLEFYGQVNFMKAGIIFSDAITTVSKQYAKEITTAAFGCGLEGLLLKESHKLFGILNGIDTTLYNPATDSAITAAYNPHNMAPKQQCKKRLLQELGMRGVQKPLFVMVSRLVHQKGVELLLLVLEQMLKEPLNCVVVGDAQSEYAKKLSHAAGGAKNFHLLDGYDEVRARKLYAAADFVLMPSLFEPCGLSQMIGACYGALPFVHSVGGLRESVHEGGKACAQGIVFTKPTPKHFLGALARALELYGTSEFKALSARNAACDFSFIKGAKRYHVLYKKIIG